MDKDIKKKSIIAGAVQKCPDARRAKTESRGVYEYTLSDKVCSATQHMSGFQQPQKGTFIVVSAPSGTGKSSICRRLLQACPEIKFSVSYTTRSPRPDEVNGKDYFFISRGEFQKCIDKGEFAEWTENYGNLYGTSLSTMKEFLTRGMNLLLDIEPRGAKEIKQKFRGGVFVFVLPPSREELLKRLKGRGHESSDVIQARYNQAERELKELSWYDYVIFNDDLETAANQLISIYIAQRCKRSNSQTKIKQFMNK